MTHPPGPQYPPPPPVVQKKRRGCLWLVGIAALAIIAVVVIVVVSVGNEASAKHKVELRATGSGPLDVTWGTGSGTSTASKQKSPWSKTVELDGFDGASVIVNLADLGKGNVSCEILVDGVSKTKQAGTGDAAMASCSAGSSG